MEIIDSFNPRPLVWGTLDRLYTRGLKIRFIPTCVGNTAQLAIFVAEKTVHPHVCGEHKNLKNDLNPASGSSPRVWGTLDIVDEGILEYRFIPTCVGNTKLFS